MKKRIVKGIALSASLALTLACSGRIGESFDESSVSSTGTTGGTLLSRVNLKVLNQDGSTLYSDQSPNSSLTLKAGNNYNIEIDASGAPSGSTFSLTIMRTDIVSGSTSTISLLPGSNPFSVAQQGDYTWQLNVTAPGRPVTTRIYQAEVTCANPTFSSASANISASLVGANNLFNFSVSGLSANGQAPYTCALDPTGVGIQDTVFKDCASFNNIYDNYVATRNVGLLVKDACNKSVALSRPVNLAYSVPAMGAGNVFIYGQTSNAQGTAQGDPRDDGVTYLATNAGGNNIVQPMYGNGTFTIDASYNYGMPSGVKFGMRIVVSGITDSINMATASGSISAANAKVKSVTYSTDQSGDELPARSFTGANCTLSNQGARVLFVTGQPCSEGTTGDNNSATVEVWGHYSCTGLSDGAGSISVSGDFDGLYNLADSCVGGGGQGGGGIVPIEF